MTLTTYPLNNVDYSAEDAELFHSTRTSGVFGDDFGISVTGADTSVTVAVGIGWIRNSRFSGKVIALKEALVLDLGLSDANYPRIDAVVIRFDANANQTNIIVKHGAAATSPVPPELVRTESQYELHLYHVRRAAGSAVVTLADISDLRIDENYCGIMADAVTKIDTAAIKARIDALISELERKIKAVDDDAYFAPAGFGLGLEEPEKRVDDLNDAIETGTYWYPPGAANAPTNSGEWVHTESYGKRFKYQTAFVSYTGGNVAERWMLNGEWQPWEWERPPMVPGVEYRTTERWNGKAVYSIALRTGEIAANTKANINIEIFGATEIISVYIKDVRDPGGNLAHHWGYPSGHIAYDANPSNVFMVNAYGSAGSWTVILKYIKN